MKQFLAAMVCAMIFASPALAIGDKDLAREAAKPAGVTQAQARAVIDAVKESIFAHLKNGEEVRLKGMGKFFRKHQKAHQAKNPRTGEKIEVPARNYLRFKAFDSGHAKLN
ncbi:MAG: HU family DNA-binding protein [Deltaproteobacteria bacterium]|nr:MAG: HU family DNA-binding protein [Deltaproteobacteria bacterium]